MLLQMEKSVIRNVKCSSQRCKGSIGVGSGKFLGVRRIFARIFSNLPETFFCTTFAYKVVPTKSVKTL